MSENVQQVRETTTQMGGTVQKTTEVSNQRAAAEQQRNVVERFIRFITGTLLVLLGFRFLLALLGANARNGFADFIYSFTQPFVSPFFNLFNYSSYNYGVSRFEIYTLVAIIMYTTVAWGIIKLTNLNRE